MKEDDILDQQNGLDKIKRYDWLMLDSPGNMEWISKTILTVDDTYQRPTSNSMINNIAREWSWAACGVIVVGLRKDKEYVVIDGQHRVLAAKKRKDIPQLPCIVFNMESIPMEALAFLKSNTNRRNILSIHKFKSQLVAEDKNAIYINNIFEKYNIVISSGQTPRGIRSMSLCYNIAEIDPRRFELIIAFLAELCEKDSINEKLLHGLYYLSKNLEVPLTDEKLRQRILKFTPLQLTRGAIASAEYNSGGGGKVYGRGILDVINVGLHNKYKFKENMVE